MEAIRKLLNWVSWLSATTGAIMILIGVFSGVFLGKSIIPAVDHMSTYFHMANSFFLITIAIFIFNFTTEYKKK